MITLAGSSAVGWVPIHARNIRMIATALFFPVFRLDFLFLIVSLSAGIYRPARCPLIIALILCALRFLQNLQGFE